MAEKKIPELWWSAKSSSLWERSGLSEYFTVDFGGTRYSAMPPDDAVRLVPAPSEQTYEWGYRSKIHGTVIWGVSETTARKQVAKMPRDFEVVRHLVGPWETVEASDGE